MRWMGYAEILMRARAHKGEAQGVLSWQNDKGIFATPMCPMQLLMSFLFLLCAFLVLFSGSFCVVLLCGFLPCTLPVIFPLATFSVFSLGTRPDFLLPLDWSFSRDLLATFFFEDQTYFLFGPKMNIRTGLKKNPVPAWGEIRLHPNNPV